MKTINQLLITFFLLSSFNANALLIKLDFDSLTSVDMWGNATSAFDVTQATGLATDSDTVKSAILAAVREDYYSTSYGFIANNQQLDIDFMIAQASFDASSIDIDNYTIQIGSRVSGPYSGFGVACLSCVSDQTVAWNTIFGSVFSNNIFSGLLSAAGGNWDLTETVNAIAGTLSHEIGHALGLVHPSGPASNPGESVYGILATGASPSNMPNDQRLLNRAFSDTNMQTLVNNIGLRSVAVPEPATYFMFLLSALFLINTRKRHYN